MELRRAPRVLIHCPVMLIGDYILGEGSVTNLSVSGCGIKSPTKVHRGTYLELRLLAPGRETPIPIELARVRWAMGACLGLEFIQVGVDQQHRLSRIVAAF